jgi:hypothetical protein
MLKTTPRKITEGMAGLDALLKAKLPVKAKYAVARLARACQDELEQFGKVREKVFKEAGCAAGEKSWTHEDPDRLAHAVKEVEEMMDAECEINALPLDLDQFGDGEVEGPAFLGLDWAMKAD